MPSSDSVFGLLQQEGYLWRSCLTTGLTALRNASLQDKGKFYTGFFQLSIGFERLMKTILVLQHLADHSLQMPSRKALRAFGHDLLQLFETVQAIDAPQPEFDLTTLESSSTPHQVLAFLSEFGKSSRYFNLDALSQPQSSGDPLHAWGLLHAHIIDAEVPPRIRAKASAQTSLVVSALAGRTFFIGRGLENRALSMHDFFEASRLQQLAAPYAVYHVLCLLAGLRSVLRVVTNRASELEQRLVGTHVCAIPVMDEFLSFLWLDRRAAFRKKRWE